MKYSDVVIARPGNRAPKTKGALVKVIVVDDNERILASVAAFLSKRGMDVRTASSPIGVRNVAAEFSPDAIVLDVMMPTLPGSKVAELIRGNGTTSEIPIVFYTAMDEQQVHVMSRGVAKSTYVLKSDGVEVLAATIERVAAP